MTASRINVSRKQDGIWIIRVGGVQVAQFIGNANAGEADVQVEILLLSAQRLAAHYKSKNIDFTTSPDDMETIKRVGVKKPKLIGLNS